MRRVLNALLDNAVKFTEAGKIEVTLAQTSEETVVQVSDTGIGIADEYLPSLFQEFTQESSGLARTHEGSGLGLAIAYRLAEKIGASISVDSEKGRGSTFTVTFPANPPAGAPSRGRSDREGVERSRTERTTRENGNPAGAGLRG